MSVDDCIAHWTKITLGPHDVLVVHVAEDGSMAAMREAVVRQRGEVPRLDGVPILITQEGTVDVEKLDEREARKLYDVLRQRFGDAR